MAREGRPARPTPQLLLYTNVANGRQFVQPPSPCFEVLPCLARSVVAVLDAGSEGVCVSQLPGATSGDAVVQEALLDLLGDLTEHGILVEVTKEQQVPASLSQVRAHGADEGTRPRSAGRASVPVLWPIKSSQRRVHKSRGVNKAR